MPGNVKMSGVEFQIKGNTETAAKGLDTLTASLGRLKQESAEASGLANLVKSLKELRDESKKKGSTTGLTSLNNSLNKIGKSYAALENVFDSLMRISMIDFSNLKHAQEAIQGIATGTKALRDARQVRETKPKTEQVRQEPRESGTEDLLPKKDKSTEETENALVRLRGVVEGIKEAFGKAGPYINAAATAIKAFVRVIKELIQLGLQAVKVALVPLQKAFEGISSLILKTGSGLLSATKNIGKFSVKFAVAPFKSLAETLKNARKSVEKLLHSIARIVMYRAIRSLIREITDGLKTGVENLYAFSKAADGVFAASMDRMNASFLYLKNSVGAAVAPLVQAFVPALERLVDVLVRLMNVMNQLFSFFTGKGSWTRAVKLSGDEAAAALEKTGSAAKEAMRYLAPFDELNIMQDKSGGGGGLDASGMFEEVPLESGLVDFFEKIKDAIDARDWRGLGTLFGDRLNEMIDNIKWKSIGKKLGTAIDGVIETLYSFLKSVDFRSLGKNLSEAFTAMLEEINTNTLGRLLVRKFTLIFDALFGFIEGLAENRSIIKKKVKDFLDGIIDEIHEWISDTNFVEEGRKLGDVIRAAILGAFESLKNHEFGSAGKAIAEYLNGVFENFPAEEFGYTLTKYLLILPENIVSFLENFNWTQFGSGIAGFVNGLVDAIGEFLSGHEWGDLAIKMADGLNTMIEEVEWEDVGATLGKSVQGFFDYIVQGLSDINWVELGKNLGASINSMMDNVNLHDAGSTLADLFTNMFDGLIALIDEAEMDKLGENIAGFINGAVEKISNWKSENEGRGKKISESIKELLKSVLTNVKWDELSTLLSDLFIDLIDSITDVLEDPQVERSLMNAFESFIDSLRSGEIIGKLVKLGGILATYLLEGLLYAIGGGLRSLGLLDDNTTDKWEDEFNTTGTKLGGAATAGILSSLDENKPRINDGFVGLIPGFDVFNEKGTSSATGFLGGMKTEMANQKPGVVESFGNLGTSISDSLANSALSQYAKRAPELVSMFKQNGADSGEGFGLDFNSQLALALLLAEQSAEASANRMKKSFTDALSNININVNAELVKIESSAKNLAVKKYAAGGFPDEGELFIAREAGPELVGSIGRRTAVVPNSDIVESVSVGVETANEPLLQAVMMVGAQVVNAIHESDRDSGSTDWDSVARTLSYYQSRQARAEGRA